jgi:hypothetical protein
MPLFGLLLWIVAGRGRHPGRLWLAPVLAALCANIHGSFVLFPVVIGLAWLEDRRLRDPRSGRTLLIGGVTAAATLATPFGPRAWVYVYDVSTNPVIRKTITEWAPLTLATVPGWLAIGSAFAVVAYLVGRARPTPWTALVTLGLFLLLALSAQRGIVWWGMVAPIVVAGLIADPSSERRPEPGAATARSPAYAIVGTLVAALIVLAPWWRGRRTNGFTGAPQGHRGSRRVSLPALARWSTNPGARGSSTRSRSSVFVDSRIEIIPDDVWHDYGQGASRAPSGTKSSIAGTCRRSSRRATGTCCLASRRIRLA